MTNPETVYQIYQAVIQDPGNYLKYYLGYLEILELKKQAAVLWSEPNQMTAVYDDTAFLYRFHSFLLQNGPADYRTLAKRLAAE